MKSEANKQQQQQKEEYKSEKRRIAHELVNQIKLFFSLILDLLIHIVNFLGIWKSNVNKKAEWMDLLKGLCENAPSNHMEN